MGQQQDRRPPAVKQGDHFLITRVIVLCKHKLLMSLKVELKKTNIQTSLMSVCSHMFNANSQKHTKDPTWSLNVNEDAAECAYVCQPT